MKVLQINSVCGVGSTGRIATDIHHILINQGHDSFIAYGRGFPINCDSTIRIGTNFDNYAHVALTRIYDKHGFGSRNATIEFLRKVEVLNPDVIHLHNIHGYYINIEMLFDYLKKSNKPVIWTLHDCWAFTGHCSHFESISCDKWKTGCSNCPQKNVYPTSLIVDNSKNNYMSKKDIFTGVRDLTIVTPSRWLSALVQESFLGEYPVEVIHNGINLDVFKPTESMFRKKHNLFNKFLILGVANNWNTKKGFAYFKELSKLLEKDEVIVLVGLSEKQKKELPKNIIGITRTNDIQELAEIYSAADVFLNPTMEDNFPTTNIEALACGTPVITFDTGGSPEIINNKCGIVVEKKGINNLKRAIETVYEKRKSSYFDFCIQRSNQLYSKFDRFNDYVNIYNNIV
ncbi:glycosyl transferase [Solibacillus sp. R5-41]|uniref:glycosyltransferase n=1 Tax=Solibacillus sp. R5-41 TaxID=2048654 RepID=UPI000C125B32|nr:glycosyltransferase [Solibacillus sp. R5-41]ATP39433.1 glycosyl transferase [Solibacillus sp. R5-41]